MKTNLDSFFKMDKDASENGVDFVAGPATFRLRRYHGSVDIVKKKSAAIIKPYAHQIQKGLISEDKAKELSIQVFVESCLISWTGVTDENGEEIPFSHENAMKLFNELPELYQALEEYASDAKHFKADLGNS